MTGRIFATVILQPCNPELTDDAPAIHHHSDVRRDHWLLVLINAVTYVKKDDIHDMEIAPNRSTYHSGPTGTRALHDFLNESGYKVIRWRESPERLLSDSGFLVNTFVVVGETQIPFTDDEAKALHEWVARVVGSFLSISDPDVSWCRSREVGALTRG